MAARFLLMWARLSFAVDYHMKLSLLLRVVPSLVSLGLAGALRAEQPAAASVRPRLEETIEQLARRNNFSGVVLVGRGETVLSAQAWGWRDVEAGAPMTIESRFALGSMSKWIATLLVLLETERGTLSLDKPVGAYLSGYRKDTGAKITLRHLLTHTSGLPNDVLAALRQDRAVAALPLRASEAAGRFASGDLQFEPGARFDYAHSNWIVVQAILERPGREPYPDQLHRLLTGPGQLAHSGIFTGDFAAVPFAARAYSAESPPRLKMDPAPGFLSCAAGFYSSAPDLLKLMHRVFHSDLFSEASRTALLEVAVPEENYALGGRVRLLALGNRQKATAWESGSIGGFKTCVAHVIDDDLTVAVLNNSNMSPNALSEMTETILRIAESQGAKE